jgi:CMP-N-acetylneuraminic acid synthetase
MIKEGKIKYLDVENHNKIITKTFITAKGTSVRCPNKNIKLLPYVLEQCRSYLNITVITDNLSIKKICDKYNVNCFLEPQEVQTGEFNSIYNYLVKTNQLDTIKEFIHLPLTQPIRNNETIMNVAYSDLTDYDFATTYSIVPNRKIFLLNDDFTYQYDSYERKGSLCKDSKMIDGYIYKIKTDFLIKIINSESPNHMFWNESKIKFVENTTGIFLDIDEPRDLKMFEIYKELYK